MSRSRKKYTPEQIIKALKNTGGIIKNAAEAIGCSRQTVYNYMDEYPEVEAARDNEVETLIDFAEEKLVEQIGQGNMTAIIFFLKCRAKVRGYVERQEVTGADGAAIAADITITRRVVDPEEDR